jgi:peroxiredoxin
MLFKGPLVLVLAAAGSLSPSRVDLASIPPAEALARPGPIVRGSDAEAKALVGTKPPPFPAIRWLDGEKRSLATLAGRVILIRSFTNACPFCVTSMPALETLHRNYGPRGLIVLGVYHPKPKRQVASEDVARFARSLGVTFPIGLDADWRLVEDWWLARTESDWTSVTWVLGRDGLIRYIHPGGEYHAEGGPDHARCRTDEHDIRRIIERLLAEPGPRRPT